MTRTASPAQQIADPAQPYRCEVDTRGLDASGREKLNPFALLEGLRADYERYVRTFQKLQNPAIRDWVLNRMDQGAMLWREPFIQLRPRFERGRSLAELVAGDLLHPDVLRVFTATPGDRSAEPVSLHHHQSEAVERILRDRSNVVIATGTGSGKSFCFGIPIISECLRQRAAGVEGIKAVIIYPMNALANSQYDDFARRLHGSGLKIALYTGDTQNNPDAALEKLREATGRTAPFDSELLSRDEIKGREPGSRLPDILMTNYQMLELLLTRFEDRVLFPAEHAGRLRFLVLDEVHTYTGKRGADVACLIRRLKQHTGSIGSLRCLGTSATVQNGDGGDEREIISSFAGRLFGEPFSPEAVVRERYVPLDLDGPAHLPAACGISAEALTRFDGAVASAAPLAASLAGRELTAAETTAEGLGILLRDHAGMRFLESRLRERAMPLSEIAAAYREELRPGASLKACEREVEAALLVGTVAEAPVHGKLEPRFVPKLHQFFSQGRTITSCLTADGPHLNDRGETTCPTCALSGRASLAFPVNFCRCCGQEFYGVSIGEEGHLEPRDIDATETGGAPAYLYPREYDRQDVPLPDGWITPTGKIKKDKEQACPEPKTYCSDCNQLDAACACGSRVQVTVVPAPFLFCPACGVEYDRRSREFNKLFSFGSIGRSTGTDILIAGTLARLPEAQRKVIAFSDNRQDTALQAAHLNNLHRRLQFRRGLYQALRVQAERHSDVGLTLRDGGYQIFEALRRANSLPTYGRNMGKYARNPAVDEKYQRYLTYGILQELKESPHRNHQNLEDAGLLIVDYNGLDAFARDEAVWTTIPELARRDPAEREDYLRGFLHVMRKRLAIAQATSSTPPASNAPSWRIWKRAASFTRTPMAAASWATAIP
jgi:hypothetical protein